MTPSASAAPAQQQQQQQHPGAPLPQGEKGGRDAADQPDAVQQVPLLLLPPPLPAQQQGVAARAQDAAARPQPAPGERFSVAEGSQGRQCSGQLQPGTRGAGSSCRDLLLASHEAGHGFKGISSTPARELLQKAQAQLQRMQSMAKSVCQKQGQELSTLRQRRVALEESVATMNATLQRFQLSHAALEKPLPDIMVREQENLQQQAEQVRGSLEAAVQRQELLLQRAEATLAARSSDGCSPPSPPSAAVEPVAFNRHKALDTVEGLVTGMAAWGRNAMAQAEATCLAVESSARQLEQEVDATCQSAQEMMNSMQDLRAGVFDVFLDDLQQEQGLQELVRELSASLQETTEAAEGMRQDAARMRNQVLEARQALGLQLGPPAPY